MGDWLQVGCAVAILYKETQLVLQPVWSSGHCEVQAVSMVVLEHLSNTLLKIGCRDNSQVGIEGQSHFLRVASRRLHYNRKDRITSLFQQIRKNDFGFVPSSIFRHDTTNSLVAPAVTAGAFERRCDVFQDRLDS